MKRRARLLALLALILAALPVLLYERTQAIDLDGQNRLVLDLRELAQLDAEWNVNILRSHIGINRNYDPLTAPLPALRALQERLQAAIGIAQGPDAALALQRLKDVLADKEELVEQFKSDNAILRNSLIYFPAALADFRAGLEPAGSPLRAELNQLLTGVLRFNLAPDPELGAEVGALLVRIDAGQAAYPEAARATLDQLMRHARAILRYRQLEDALEARITATPTAAAIDALGACFDRAFGQILLEKQRYRSVLLVYCGVLLLLLVLAGLRLRRSYRVIAIVNGRLKAANATLELRVAERTAELQAQSAQLEQLAQHDSLTGLINYGQLVRLLGHALLRAERRNTTVAVMFIDLDGFKAVNDTYGHAVGDLVLQAVAARVQTRLRQEDALARLGGDEFVILLEEVGSRDGALRVAQEALDEISRITQADGHPVRISASIGISSAVGGAGLARGPAALLSEADQAMYQAKQAGKGCYAFSEQARWNSPALPVR